MGLDWIRENPPHWDADKLRVIGGAPPGALDVGPYRSGETLPGEWWRVEDAGHPVGYGWMDYTWGDAEMLLAVDPHASGRGIGTFILDRLEDEARKAGVNYLYNVILPTHPERDRVAAWLKARRFEPSHDGNRLMRRVQPAG